MIIEIGSKTKVLPMNWRSAEIVLVYNDEETYIIGKDTKKVFAGFSDVITINDTAKMLLTRGR